MFILERAFRHFDSRPDRIALSFSGAEDVVLIDMAKRICPDKQLLQIFTLDTGRLHPQTYEFIERVRSRYQLAIDILSPETKQVEDLVRSKGLFSFYRDGHQECCYIRKVQPLERKLTRLDSWITGQRRDQSPGTRQSLEVVELDSSNRIKWNPLAFWAKSQVWEYISQHKIPFNTLHTQGFHSIGCAPCTRPCLPGQHEREGRWWWEVSEKKKCGLHKGKRKL